jgi:hypothetical protein
MLWDIIDDASLSNTLMIRGSTGLIVEVKLLKFIACNTLLCFMIKIYEI